MPLRSCHRYMEFLSKNGFNAIRLPFNHQSMLADDTIELTGTLKAKELRDLSYSEMFRTLAQRAAKYGILVMLTCHRTTPSAWPGDGLWYDSAVSEKQVLASWSKVNPTTRITPSWATLSPGSALAPWCTTRLPRIRPSAARHPSAAGPCRRARGRRHRPGRGAKG